MSNSTLANDISITSGFAFSSALFDPEHGEPLIRIRDIQGQKTVVKYTGTYSEEFVVNTGELLVGMDGDFNVVRWLGTKALLNQRVCKIQSISAELHQGFLFWYLQPKLKDIHATTPQTTVKHLSVKDIYAIEKPNLNFFEQEMVADVLDTIDSQIRKTETIIAKLRQVKQGMLHDLLTRGIDENGELRPSYEDASELYKPTELGWIPKGWTEDYLTNMIDFPSGQVDPKVNPYSEMFLVAPDHIESRTGRLLSKETAREQGAISGKYLFNKDDVVYSKIRPYLRKAYLAEFKGICSADSYPMTAKKGVLPKFLHMIILSENFSSFAESVSMRSGFPKINRTELSEYKTYWPKESEQEKIIGRYEQLIETLDEEQSQLSKLTLVKSGLMDDLLTGKVRVTDLIKQQQTG
ncbi:restriction endonuclease subunit S [Pseudoalteromonas fuliginea]|uniref:Restriction endonuclease subunit S n=1 Tax=Pseudoalteromonas fuliginea TaxID=1872678 RepID=A0ABQ6RD84_9GAMM|nr:restriction endonuclease subunit S [Pseudoalteromonas fuliginea]KAA1150489.1 restriction endonuclease subunit S [Pseudoalteromonas fuliginea]KAA1165228.1 restriction endonuclease subunit S [Pseudoalteromonas fuliginea]